ncbi:MAG TPA: dinitrogenase iron-molybdenum cofactor biosynthesis protein [Firmicutes bacterium]|nr:dinitrogenase iron-molybdenum cofactor biosynthesis protein [Bacillota bacterium]
MGANGTVRVAIPSARPGGLDADRSGHFGRCDCFTLVDLEGGQPKAVAVVENLPHTDGGCLRPVNVLAAHQVDALVVGGIGFRPLQGFRAAGIEVYVGNGEKVRQAVEDFAQGKLPAMTDEGVCGGH